MGEKLEVLQNHLGQDQEPLWCLKIYGGPHHQLRGWYPTGALESLSPLNLFSCILFGIPKRYTIFKTRNNS